MAKPRIDQYDDEIRKLVYDGLSARQIYVALNYNNRVNGLSDVISQRTIARRHTEYNKIYRPWLYELLPHEVLFKELEKKEK